MIADDCVLMILSYMDLNKRKTMMSVSRQWLRLVLYKMKDYRKVRIHLTITPDRFGYVYSESYRDGRRRLFISGDASRRLITSWMLRYGATELQIDYYDPYSSRKIQTYMYTRNEWEVSKGKLHAIAQY